VASRSASRELVSVVLYEDPLWPWCLVAERRIRAVLDDLSPTFAPLRLEPFLLRLEPRLPSRHERRTYARVARKAAKEPEAARTTPDLWLSEDPPLTTMPIHAALVAARQQGAEREEALRTAIREAGLVRGINVTRHDVLYELAEAAGLDVRRFETTFSAPATERRVRETFEAAIDRGIEGAPALVIGDEWLVCGPRTADEYRDVLQRYMSQRLGFAPPRRTVH
jgi:predicted DsbA family dithiol-disulfide isomerase